MAQLWERLSSVGREGGRQTAQSTGRVFQRFWILNCCVTPQSDIARVRIDRSMIGSPTDFRHIGHMGASDTSGSSYDARTLNCLLASKGSDEFGVRVPSELRHKDVPISRPITASN